MNGDDPQQNIIRHGEERPFELAVGGSEHIPALESHIEAHVGKVDWVFHELLSDAVHIDVHHVAPSTERPFHALVTTGMSDRPMSVPEGCEQFRFAELVVLLPPEWPASQDHFGDESVYWPVRFLKYLARLPHKYDTWLGWGHTIPHGNPPEPFCPSTRLCGAVIAEPSPLPEPFYESRPPSGNSPVWFYGVWPLYAEEMNFKLAKGAESLLGKLTEAGISCVTRANRQNVCRRRWGPF